MTILYLDASALAKRYVQERYSDETASVISEAEMVGTSIVSRAEVAAALSKAVRVGALVEKDALTALKVFHEDWPDLVRVQLTEMMVEHADRIAWNLRLRGYDAIHLASALAWQDMLGENVMIATFDHALWTAADKEGLIVFPADLPELIQIWQAKARKVISTSRLRKRKN